MKVAIVHDWLVGGGAELVVEQLHKMYPDAPIYTSYATDEWRKKLDGKVVTGYLQYWPFSRLRKFVPILRQRWFSQLKLEGYDLVISSSGAEAKGIHVPKGTLHINYCHAPTHYYWSRYEQYIKNPGWGMFDFIGHFGLKLLLKPMRKWDYKAAQLPDYMIANSTHIKNEIKKYYGREAVVIHPPVDVARFTPKTKEIRRSFVTAGRQTPYKRIDLAVAACTKLNLPLIVIGTGPDHKKLRAQAGPSVQFVGFAPRDEVVHYFQQAKGFIFPGLDDFGIVAVEALAAGAPVIAYKAGGVLDYVEDGKTGVLFDQQTTESLTEVLQKFQAEKFNTAVIQSVAQKFSADNFRRQFKAYLDSLPIQGS